MSFDLDQAEFLLKEHYSDQVVKTQSYNNNPLHALLAKNTKFGGKNKPQPVVYGTPQGRSATFSNAKAQQTNSKGVSFLLTRTQDYSLATVDNETMMASQGDDNAFLEAATLEFDGAFHSLMRSLAISEYRGSSGSIGLISAGSDVTTDTITLAEPADIVNFEVGMTLKVSSAVGSGERTGDVVVEAIDRSSGTITVAEASWDDAAGITAVAAGDSIHVSGDFNKKISGLADWIPYTAPGATLFFNVDRTADVSRLSGQRKDVSALPIEEALVDLASLISREGGKPDNSFMNFDNYANLEKALGAKVQYVTAQDADALISFEGIAIQGQKGKIKCIPDSNCPAELTYMLQMDTIKLESLGEAPMLLTYEGNKFLRVSDADAVEGRAGYYAQMNAGRAPGWNGVGKLR